MATDLQFESPVLHILLVSCQVSAHLESAAQCVHPGHALSMGSTEGLVLFYIVLPLEDDILATTKMY